MELAPVSERVILQPGLRLQWRVESYAAGQVSIELGIDGCRAAYKVPSD